MHELTKRKLHMTHLKTILTASAIALMTTACASTYNKSDKMAAKESTKTETMTEKSMDKMDDKKMMDDKMSDAKMMDEPMMAEESVMVGGAAMLPSKTIVENASAASNLTTLVAAVAQAGLVETLSSDGPFTVFAPTNTAFDLVGGDTVSTLMMDENKEQLVKVLTAHVVPGKIDAATLIGLIGSNGGSYDAQTVSGDTLTFYVMGGEVKVADESGRLATVTTADVMQSNGVVHVVNSVLIPK